LLDLQQAAGKERAANFQVDEKVGAIEEKKIID
jgi:hypothetical protein